VGHDGHRRQRHTSGTRDSLLVSGGSPTRRCRWSVLWWVSRTCRGAVVEIISIAPPPPIFFCDHGQQGLTYPGLDIVAGALPFLRRDVDDGVGAGTGAGWGCGDDGRATRCRLGLRADGGDSVAPWAELVLPLRFRVLGTGMGVGGIGGEAVADSEAAVAVGLGMEEAAAWLAA
jgi:hypothetical protein